MTRKSILMTSASALIFSSALVTAALADDYDATPVRYDSQAEQTRELNNQALARAQAENNGDATQGDDDDDQAVVPTDDDDSLDDDDDDDDDTPDGAGNN